MSDYKEYRGDGAAYADDADDWECVNVSSAKVLETTNTAVVCSDAAPATQHNEVESDEEDFGSGEDGWLVVDALADGGAAAVTDCHFSATPDSEHPAEGRELPAVAAAAENALLDPNVDTDENEKSDAEFEQSEEQEEVEDEHTTMSREYSNNDEEWVLETILKRRRAKQPARCVDDDEGEEYLNVHEYLCKWKWYDEPTWEPRQMIEDLGHVKLLDAFDETHRSDRQGKKHDPDDDSAEAKATVSAWRSNRFPLGTLESFIGTHVIMSAVIQATITARFRMSSVAPVLKGPGTEQQFLRLWHEHFHTCMPRVVYSRIPLEHIHSSSMLRASLPVIVRDAKVRSNLSIPVRPAAAKATSNLVVERFVVYLILGGSRISSSRADFSPTQHKLSALMVEYPRLEFATHLSPFVIAAPLWVVEGRLAHPREFLERTAPCRVSLEEMYGETSDEDVRTPPPPKGDGVVKMTSSEGQVYYKKKREKKVTKPKGAVRDQQSSLRLDKMR